MKVLGAIAILDQGQTDWKIIAVDVNDSLSSKLTDISDVEVHLPDFLGKLKDWYCLYKIPEGKPPNEVALCGQLQDRRLLPRNYPFSFRTLSDNILDPLLNS